VREVLDGVADGASAGAAAPGGGARGRR